MQKFKEVSEKGNSLSHSLTCFFESGVQESINNFCVTLTFMNKKIKDLLLIFKTI